MRIWLVVSAAALVVATTAAGLASASRSTPNRQAAPPEGWTYRPRGSHPPGDDWAFPEGDEAATNFSTLKQLTPANVSKLHVVWQKSFTPSTFSGQVQSSPIVLSGKGKNLPLE